MKQKHAFFIAVFITFIIAGNWLFFNASSLFPDREIVIISRVIDGDTVELEDGRTIRLLNINTPEKGEFGSELSAGYLSDFINENVGFEYAGIEKYGRTLGRIYSDNYINLKLVQLGFASPFLVNDKEIEEFRDAQREAVDENKGIWERSEYYGCLDVEINKKEEFVVIEDECGLNFQRWSVKDESTKKYTFKKEFRAEKFKLNSAKGTDTETEVFWGRDNIWNNDRDSIFIRDKNGFLVYFDSYGY